MVCDRGAEVAQLTFNQWVMGSNPIGRTNLDFCSVRASVGSHLNKINITDAQNRRSNNLEILNLLYKIVEKYPDLRFGQIIEVFCKDLKKDLFYEEPDVVLQRVKNKYYET